MWCAGLRASSSFGGYRDRRAQEARKRTRDNEASTTPNPQSPPPPRARVLAVSISSISFTPLQLSDPFYILLPQKDQVLTGELIHEWYAFCVSTCGQYRPLTSHFYFASWHKSYVKNIFVTQAEADPATDSLNTPSGKSTSACALSQRFTFICKLLFTIVMQVSLFLFTEASNLKKAVTLEKQWFGAGHSKYAFSFVFCCSFSPWYYLQHIFFSLKSLSDHCSTQRLTSMVAKVLADFYIILKRAQQTSQQLC